MPVGPFDSIQVGTKCVKCKGTGTVNSEQCKDCGGHGATQRRWVSVRDIYEYFSQELGRGFGWGGGGRGPGGFPF